MAWGSQGLGEKQSLNQAPSVAGLSTELGFKKEPAGLAGMRAQVGRAKITQMKKMFSLVQGDLWHEPLRLISGEVH